MSQVYVPPEDLAITASVAIVPVDTTLGIL